MRYVKKNIAGKNHFHKAKYWMPYKLLRESEYQNKMLKKKLFIPQNFNLYHQFDDNISQLALRLRCKANTTLALKFFISFFDTIKKKISTNKNL